MNTFPLSLLLSFSLARSILAQGPLAPTSAPTPTMKTLDQVQPRTPIDTVHTPGDGSNQFIINAGGSYYLTANIPGTSGKNGIAIAADNVTVDLNGFAVVGTGGSLSGVVVSGSHQNLAIYNGSVGGWGGKGIDAGNANNAQLTRLRFAANATDGVGVGSNSIVRDCVATGNANGIHVTGTGSRVEDNIANSNSSAGIRVDTPGNLIIKNNATSNAGADYNIDAGSSYGQIVQTPGANFTNATAWANFSSSCPGGQVFCSGVCANLSSNPANCGTCGNACTAANAATGCSGGNCTIASCNAGFANCNNQYADGCEVNTFTNPNNCGGCGLVCSGGANVASSGCSAGSCVISACNSGFGNCDGQYANGCETNLNNSVSNCGSCGNVCSAGANVSTTSCSGGACGIATCNTGFANCNNQYADGCEVNLTTNVSNCGACGNVCTPGANVANTSCTASVCTIASCNAGFANCNNNAADGCEVNTKTDPNHCGSCATVCSPGHLCSNGVCQ